MNTHPNRKFLHVSTSESGPCIVVCLHVKENHEDNDDAHRKWTDFSILKLKTWKMNWRERDSQQRNGVE